MSPRVKQFIELQRQVNAQIDKHGIADDQLVGELDLLGDQLTNDEIYEVSEWYLQQMNTNDETDEWEVLDEMMG